MKYRPLIVVLFFASCCWGQATDAPVDSPDYTAKQIRRTLVRQAQDYDIRAAKGGPAWKLHTKSLLNWNNPGRSTEQGVLMVWLDEGMPMVLASLFTYDWLGTKTKHEFISLASTGLEVELGGEVAWTPSRPGVKWIPFEGKGGAGRASVGLAGNSKGRRMTQMRSIARRFEVRLKNPETNNVAPLRLMSQPVFRFESKKHNTLDGAIFSFCVATDPEAFLLMRANEERKWEFAFVQSIDWEVSAWLSKKKVWSVERVVGHHNNLIGNPLFISDPYVSFHLTSDRAFRPHPELEETIR